MKVAVCKVEVETFGPDAIVRKIPVDSRFLDVETDATMTMTEIGQWLNSRGWYYAGHRGFRDGHLFTYMPGKHAVHQMVETAERPPWEDHFRDDSGTVRMDWIADAMA